MGADGADGGMDKGDGKGDEACGGTIFLLFFFFLRSSYPFGKGIIVPCLLGCSKCFCKYNCSLQKQVGLFSESHSVGSILHMALFLPSRKA